MIPSRGSKIKPALTHHFLPKLSSSFSIAEILNFVGLTTPTELSANPPHAKIVSSKLLFTIKVSALNTGAFSLEITTELSDTNLISNVKPLDFKILVYR